MFFLKCILGVLPFLLHIRSFDSRTTMTHQFSEIDLSDNVTPTQSNDSPENVRARRKHFPSALKQLSNSPSTVNQPNPSLSLDASFHEFIASVPLPPPPPLSLLDNSLSGSSNSSFSTPSSSSRYPTSSSSASPPPTTVSSEPSSSSPKHLIRSTGSLDLSRRSFLFPLTRQDSIIDSLLSAIYEREGSTYGLSSSQDSDTITTGDFTDRSIDARRLSGDSMTNSDAIIFSKSNLANKSKPFPFQFDDRSVGFCS